MKILCSFHHEQLHESLALLGSRLGAKVFRPIGMEWFHDGLWHVHESEETAQQYLGPHTYLNYKGVTLADAKQCAWDVIITTYLPDYEHMEKLRRDHCPKAKHVLQVGNQWDLSQVEDLKNVLNASSAHVPDGVHFCRYHPEFQFTGRTQPASKNIASFMHCPSKEAEEIGYAVAKAAGCPIKFYGAGGFNGPVGLDRILNYLHPVSHLLHHKLAGDGYGFVLHQALAHGIPAIINLADYRDKLAGKLLIEGATCINSTRPAAEIAGWIKACGPKDYQRVAELWRRHCCPEREFEEILKPFFNNLK
jgi:hypothetical protein